ncbi:MAG: hypothetical protein M3Y36_01345 [Actinomycetota bacterium]|nr:hypothetical protein [Actinomycetota bacterium]
MAKERRSPSTGTGDAVGLQRWFSFGPEFRGRPKVLVHRGDMTRVRAGASVNMGDDVELLLGGNHRIDWVTAFSVREIFALPGAYQDNPWSGGDIELGDDVVVGRGARIVSGVAVGDGAVILPYSVVTRDVAPGSVVGGHPAVPVTGRQHATVRPGRPTREGSTMEASEAQRISLVMRARGRSARMLRSAAEHLDRSILAPLPLVVDPPGDPSRVTMGTASYFEPVVRCAPGIEARVTVGNYASVSYDTECLFSGLEPQRVGPTGYSAVSSALPEQPVQERHITMGHDVWVTRGTRVLAGVTIGDGAVVAAYSVVSEDVRPYAIVAGNPAREVARRFDDATVEALLRIRWWDWTEAEVKARYRELCSPDVAGFVRRHDRHRRAQAHPDDAH